MNGPVDSNMTKIDEALGQKADSSTTITATLTATAWVGTDAPYTQMLTIAGLGANQNGMIAVAHSATADQRKAAREAMLSIVNQSDGTLTIAADGVLPELSIPVTVTILG